MYIKAYPAMISTLTYIIKVMIPILDKLAIALFLKKLLAKKVHQ